MKQECLLSAVLVLAACASSPEQTAQRGYQRETSRIEAFERFEKMKRACADAGGTMQITRQSSGRMSPTTAELDLATCSSLQGRGRTSATY